MADPSSANVICNDDVCTMVKNANKVAETSGDEPWKDVDDSSKTTTDDDKPKRPHKNKKTPVPSVFQMLHSQSDLDTLVSNCESVVIEFKTSWCGACKAIQPRYEELAGVHKGSVHAAVVMCDKNKVTKKLALSMGVGSYPVFILYQNGRDAGRCDGANVGKLEKAFEKLSGGGGGKKKGGRRR